MKRTFLAGLAILLPIAITLFIVIFVIDLFTAPFVDIVEEIISYYGKEIAPPNRHLLIFASRVIVFLLLIFFIFLLGFLGRKIFFSWFLHLTDRLFSKIPIIKTIYLTSREITTNFLKKEKTYFKGRVIVPFPHKTTRAFGLLSGDAPKDVTKREKVKDKELQSIFIPTAPQPISGFLLMYAKDEIKEIDITTEDLFKFLISCGTFEPGKEEEKQGEK
jgi:uncharacterized membrane protein